MGCLAVVRITSEISAGVAARESSKGASQIEPDHHYTPTIRVLGFHLGGEMLARLIPLEQSHGRDLSCASGCLATFVGSLR